MGRQPRSRWRVAGVALLIALLVSLGGAALAQDGDDDDPRDDDFVVLTGRLDVPEGTIVSDAVIFHGPASVAGIVAGDLIAFDGPVTVSGEVLGDVVAFNGRVTVEPTGHVAGDVRSRRTAIIEEGGRVDGETGGVSFGPVSRRFRIAGRIAVWVALSASTFLLGLLLLLVVPRGLDAAAAAASARTGASVGWGFAAFLGLPALGIVALITLVGIPLGIALLMGLWLLYLAGYTVSAWILGRRLLRTSTARVLVFLAGWAVLRAVAIVPVLGGLVWVAAAIFGLGAATVAARRSGATVALPPPPPAV